MSGIFNRRNLLRLVLTAVFAVLALGVLPESVRPWRVLLPSLSPLLGAGGALAARSAGVLTLLALPLLVLPLFKGRLFCWRLCPMGFVAELTGRLNPRGSALVTRVRPLGKWLALALVGSAATGYPLFIWADPLCIFNGFFAAWHQPLTWAASTTAAGFVCVVALSLLVPNVWCHRLCPLGGLQEALAQFADHLRARRRAAAAPARLQVGRRPFLAFLVGAAAAGVNRSLGRPASAPVIRPPGACDVSAFGALCARCGNCVNACPYGLIVPDLGQTGIEGLFTPLLKFRSQNAGQEQFCFQDCNACALVCPTGAIRRLKIEQKRQLAIGVARIDRKACIAWEKGESCVVCQEFCPYQAIVEVDRKGVKCPTVDEAKCRGCGACESQCPAQPLAIVVEGRHPQRVLQAPPP